MENKSAARMWKVLGILLSLIPALSIFSVIPTTYQRDVWFSGDSVVTRHIVMHGQIPRRESEIATGLSGTAELPSGISSSIDHFFKPTLQAIISITTGMSQNLLSSSTPFYLLIILVSTCLLLRILNQKQYAFIFGPLLGVAPVYTVNGFLSLNVLPRFVMFVGILSLILYFDESRLAAFPIILISIWLGIQKPEIWAIFSATLVLGCLIKSAVSKRYWFVVSSPIVTTLSLLPVIFSFSNYQYYLAKVVSGLVYLRFSLPTSSNSVKPPYVLAHKSYGLIAFVPVACLGVIGGVLFIRRILHQVSGQNNNVSGSDIVIFSWGTAVLMISVSFLASGTFYVITRTYTLAFPLVLIGAAIYISRVKKDDLFYPDAHTFIIIIVFACVIFLQVSTPHADINTINDDASAWGEWSQDYASELVVLGDRTTSAVLADHNHYLGRQPTDVQSHRLTFYENDFDSFNDHTDSHSDMVVLYDSMTNDGLYTQNFAKIPITSSSYNTRVTNSHQVYSNGEYHVLL
ncbi:hypothetical protein [Haloarcula sp. H-GB5]